MIGNRYSMVWFSDWPNPLRSGAMRNAPRATRGMIFPPYCTTRFGFPVQKKKREQVDVRVSASR